ncbi:alpha-amylase family glycosyl hydrolase [Marinoscillum sp.]|uniref:alpha-amylase family glycosyl hydrolase n=1 Tax=Marinoscillum sp. TaxID=2024838 RepID=UPI003BA9BD87
MTKQLLFLLLVALTFACSSPSNQTSTEESEMKPTKERVIVYQMFTRLFSNTNQTNKPWGTLEENGVGKFNEISEKALDEIKNLGITHVWYTGVIEHALLTDYTAYGIPLDDADVVKGRAGSPYAIKDYYDVNPDLAESVASRMAEFEELVKRTHDAGLKVIVDFVPNHVARGYQSDAKPNGVIDFGEDDDTTVAFAPNNNFYYLPGTSFQVPEGYNSLGDNSFPTKDGKFDETPAKATGNDVFNPSPSIYDWFETVKLNYGVEFQQQGRIRHFADIPDTWYKMRDILLFWASKDVDGFRCDMAEMVPVEFWEWVTNEVKNQYPEITFTAEIYNPNAYRNYINKGGFDYLYDKVELYDTLKGIIQNRMNTDAITGIWQRQEGIGPNMLRFLENHDEQRIASPDFAGNMWKGIPMMAVTSFMHTGPVMLYFGQEVGEPGKGESGFGGDDGRTTIFDYWGVPEHIKWVNEGAFDGGQLSEDQKSLRKAYRDILRQCNESEAFREGDFYDLHYYNRNNDYTGYTDKVYAFVRHTANEVVLVITNFDSEPQTASIKVPEPAWETFGLTNSELQADGRSFSKESTLNYDTPSELIVEIPAMSYKIVKLSQ